MSTIFLIIVFLVSLILLGILITLRIRDLRSGKLEKSDIPHYDTSLVISILIFIKRELVFVIKRSIQNFAIFLVKIWILGVHKARTLIKKKFPFISKKEIWEKTGTIIFHNFNEYRAKIRRFKRHIKEKEESETPIESVDENQNLV